MESSNERATLEPVMDKPHRETPLTRQDVKSEVEERLSRIQEEFRRGFEVIGKYPKSVTFFGSARLEPGDTYYKAAQTLASEVSNLGYAVVSGGGPGIMAAANQGAHEAGGDSVGFNIELPHEQVLNHFVNDSSDFRYFFSRKVLLAFSAEAYVYFPGGFGTLDEFFEIITLIQTNKIERVPVICFGSDFWNPVKELATEILLKQFKTISPEDLDLFVITDDAAEALEIIKAAPQRHE